MFIRRGGPGRAHTQNNFFIISIRIWSKMNICKGDGSVITLNHPFRIKMAWYEVGGVCYFRLCPLVCGKYS